MKKYNLKQDHKAIKKQIKGWELELNHLIHILLVNEPITAEQQAFISHRLENMTNEMMSINIWGGVNKICNVIIV